MSINKNFNNNECATNRKNIVVSVILTESTASLLDLDLPHLEEFASEDNLSSLCATSSKKDDELPASEEIQLRPSEISSETVYFTTVKQFQESDISLEDNDDSELFHQSEEETNDNVEAFTADENDNILERVDAFIRPLIAVKSMAHDNRLKNQDNNIYVSVINSELTVTNSGWMNVCRICHGGESVGNLISPCRCRGSIALTHLECLERWLKQSTNSHCELCQHHFQIIREPKYNIPKSIFLFLRHPGDHLRDLIVDLITFLIYTPSAISSTYMLMLVCESVAKNSLYKQRSIPGHILTFSAIFGMAVIDFTYSSWLMGCLQRHTAAWKEWYKVNCTIKLVLPERKLNQHHRKDCTIQDEID